MKLVINKCYGGFGLSPLATKRLAELQGRECYLFKGTTITGSSVPATVEELGNSLFWEAYDIPNPQEVIVYPEGKSWHSCSDEEKQTHNDLYNKHSLYYRRSIERTDPFLIQVVEELGEKASGSCASLEVIEIPDDVEYEIEENDGYEWVSEKHRKWS